MKDGTKFIFGMWLIFMFLFGSIVFLLISPFVVPSAFDWLENKAFGAETPPVPYAKSDENLCDIGRDYALADGTIVNIVPALAQEVVVRALNCDEEDLRDEKGEIVPRRIEIRKYDPEVPSPQRMPLLRVMWDANGDGIADYISIVVGYQNGNPVFQTKPLGPDVKRKMSEQGHFRVTLPKFKES